MNIILLAIGGGIGAVCRYLLGKWIMKKFPHPPLPIAMLIVNLIGSFMLGIFLGIYLKTFHLMGLEDLLFLMLGVGFFGAFTTFSTFSVEATELLKKRLWKKAFLYITFSMLGSIVVFLLGYLMFSL